MTGCAEGKGLRLECLRADFVAKLRNRTKVEMSAIDECGKRLPSEPLGGCLGYRQIWLNQPDLSCQNHSVYSAWIKGRQGLNGTDQRTTNAVGFEQTRHHHAPG